MHKKINLTSGNSNIINQKRLRKCIKIVAKKNFNQYTSPKGLKELRIKLSTFLYELWNQEINPMNIMITSGSQQSLNLIIDTLLTQKDTILIEQPTYYGALKIFKIKNIKMIGIPIQEEGINLKILEKRIKQYHPKMIYTTPTFNNPTGYAWTNENRTRFLEIINKYNIIVIEDDPYSLINYSKEKFHSLYQLNKGKNIIYLGTFAKYISPSINIGYILGNHKIISSLYDYKESYDLSTSLFNQLVVLNYLTKYNLIKEIKKKIPLYEKKLKKMQRLIKEEFGYAISMTNPKGGLFFLVESKEIFKNQKEEKKYFIHNTKKNYTRINICAKK